MYARRSDQFRSAWPRNNPQRLRLQYQFSFVAATYDAIQVTLSPARLGRYLSAAGGDKHLAFRLYVWNGHICQSLYFPLQTVEVAARNAIVIPIRKRFGDSWFTNPKFINLLPARMKDELAETVSRERKRRRIDPTQHHIIGALSFGFWQDLMGASYDKHLWANGLGGSFPNAPANVDRAGIYVMLGEIRMLRNDVMHHYAIFDQRPQARYQTALTLAGYICAETHWLITHLSQVSQVINDRPAI